LRQGGWSLHYAATAVVVHRGGASTRQACDLAALSALAARQRFFRKHRGSVYALVHRLLNAVVVVAKMTALTPLAVALPAQRDKVRLQWRLLRWCYSGGAPDHQVAAPSEAA
jgi:GT2 family glycosyltransferase